MTSNSQFKVQTSGFVWGNSLYQLEGFYFSGFRKAKDVQILSEALFATNIVTKKNEHKQMRGRGQSQIKTRIERSNFRQFLANFRVLGPPSKNSKCHNSINIGS